MTEIELKNTIQRANRAEELLNDEMISGFIIACRGDLLKRFEDTELIDEKERLNLWQQTQVLNLFVSQFTKKIKEGKNAKTELNFLAKAAQNIRRII